MLNITGTKVISYCLFLVFRTPLNTFTIKNSHSLEMMPGMAVYII